MAMIQKAKIMNCDARVYKKVWHTVITMYNQTKRDLDACAHGTPGKTHEIAGRDQVAVNDACGLTSVSDETGAGVNTSACEKRPVSLLSIFRMKESGCENTDKYAFEV